MHKAGMFLVVGALSFSFWAAADPDESVFGASTPGLHAWPSSVKKGDATAASWNGSYRGNEVGAPLATPLMCPSLYAGLQTVTIANGQVTFDVWLGAKNASGAPSKRGQPDDRAHVKVTAPLTTNHRFDARIPFTADNLAWVSENGDKIAAQATGLAISGHAANVNHHSSGGYMHGRALFSTVTLTGATGTCSFVAEASDFHTEMDDAFRAMLGSHDHKEGDRCITSGQCASGSCVGSFDYKVCR